MGKKRKYHTNIHKAMSIQNGFFQINNNVFGGSSKNACSLESADHLWQPFLVQQQSDVIVFAIITFKNKSCNKMKTWNRS